jgi:hypothetical protein
MLEHALGGDARATTGHVLERFDGGNFQEASNELPNGVPFCCAAYPPESAVSAATAC